MIPLEIQKRTNHISIEDMQSEVTKIDGKEVKLCLNCNKPIPARNHKYCGPQCSTEFFAKHSQKGLRLYVFKRENGTCQKCGWKNPSFDKPYPKRPAYNPKGIKAYREDEAIFQKALDQWHLEIAEHRKKLRDFTADHIVPIALGGEEFDLKNIQLLCEVCDKAKTARDAAMIARRRKEIKRVGGTAQLDLFNMSDLHSVEDVKK